MLISEVTNAQDQLNLLKKIIDNTWTAISAEAAAKAAARQQRAAASAAKPRARRTVVPATKVTATKPTAPTPSAANKAATANATTATKQAASSVQQNATISPTQTVAQQPRRVYPASTAKPIARLGRVTTDARFK